jgi:hypothetical protein
MANLRILADALACGGGGGAGAAASAGTPLPRPGIAADANSLALVDIGNATSRIANLSSLCWRAERGGGGGGAAAAAPRRRICDVLVVKNTQITGKT